jgi:hypothetical protein
LFAGVLVGALAPPRPNAPASSGYANSTDGDQQEEKQRITAWRPLGAPHESSRVVKTREQISCEFTRQGKAMQGGRSGER